MTEETFEIKAGGSVTSEWTFLPQGIDWDDVPEDIKTALADCAGLGDIDMAVALSLATDGHFVNIDTANMALSGISFLKERWEYRNMELIETVSNAIHSDPLLKAVYDFAKCEVVAHEWRSRGADGRYPNDYHDLAVIPLEESAQRVDSELKSRATIQHYEVLIANQAAYVASLEPGKRRDAEQLKLDNLRAELVKAQ